MAEEENNITGLTASCFGLYLGAWSFFRCLHRSACAFIFISPLLTSEAASSDALFTAGTQAYKDADFDRSAAAFRQSAALQRPRPLLLLLPGPPLHGGAPIGGTKALCGVDRLGPSPTARTPA